MQVNQNYQIAMHVLTTLDVSFVSEVSVWLYSFITYVETEEEAAYSMTKLTAAITDAAVDGDATSALVESTILFVETKFETELRRMGNWNYMKQWSGWVGRTASLRAVTVPLPNVFGPKPKHHVHQAANCIITHTEEVYQTRATEAHTHLQESKQKRKQNAEETDENLAQRLFSSDIVGVKNDSAFDQYRLSHNYK